MLDVLFILFYHDWGMIFIIIGIIFIINNDIFSRTIILIYYTYITAILWAFHEFECYSISKGGNIE